eukprot:6204042-Pleurochrysis_carterae.AAC.3
MEILLDLFNPKSEVFVGETMAAGNRKQHSTEEKDLQKAAALERERDENRFWCFATDLLVPVAFETCADARRL